MTFILGVVAVVLLWWLLKSYIRVDPALMAGKIRQIAGFAAIGGAFFMGVRGRIDVAIFLGGLGAWLIGWGGRPAWLGGGGQANPARFRTALLDVVFDPGTRAIDGQVIGGSFAGRPLASLDLASVLTLRRECRMTDPGGIGLLEAYLDGRFPGWREHADADGDARSEVRRDPGAMTEEQAYQVLGLGPGAGADEIRRAHRALIKKLHPDQGGERSRRPGQCRQGRAAPPPSLNSTRETLSRSPGGRRNRAGKPG